MSLRASRRGLVPPFIAMDVLRAANAREADGADVIHLEARPAGNLGAGAGARGRPPMASRCDPALIKAIARGRALVQESRRAAPDRSRNWPIAIASPAATSGA